MKRKIIAIILGVTIMLTVVACGKKEESQDEMLQMINNQEAITIEIAEPINQEQGTTIEWDWEALAKTQTHPEFRENFDDILNITAHGTDGKNGVLYVDPAGNHTNDSTLRYAFQNKKFIDKVWNNTETTKQLIDLAKETFTDVETDQEALIAAINAYYNLILDSEPGYANLNSTVTRIEAMATVHRADTPINDILDKTTYNEEFDVAIGYHEYSLLAQELASQNYLNYKNKSLDEETANNTITRAEFIYLLVQRYYSEEYASVTGKEKCYSDCKNGGNIALDVGFITKDKSTGEITYKDRWQSYELSYALNNSKVGMPDDLYKAMVVAQNHNLITGSESRWDDGLTKGEAINFIIKVYTDLGTITNADRGESTGSVIENNQTSEADSTVSNGELTAEDPYSAFSSKNVTNNGDYTYTFTDDFISAVMEMPQYQKYSTYQIKYMLNVLGMFIKDFEEDETKEVYDYLNQWSADDIEVMVGGAGEEENIAQEKPAPEVDQSDITALNTTMYSKGDVNVRKGPSTDYEKIGALTLNQEVKITGQSKSTGWYRIELNGGEGYVSQNYLSNSKITTPAPSTGGNGSNDGVGPMDHLFDQGTPDWGGSTGHNFGSGLTT